MDREVPVKLPLDDYHPGDEMILSILGDQPSKWDSWMHRTAATKGAMAAIDKLAREWPSSDEDGEAKAIGRVRALLGY